MKRDVETRTSIPPELPGCEKQQADFDRFVKYMNAKAAAIGMSGSLFRDAAGIHNRSTARDLLRLAVAAKQYPLLDHIWSQNTFTSAVMGPNARTRDSISKSRHPDLDNYYRVLGKKGGSLISSAKKLFVYNLVSFLEIPGSDDVLAVVAMYAPGSNDSPENRFLATRQIADIAMKRYGDPDADVSHMPVCCENGIAAVLPAGGKTYDDLRILYEKEADEPGRPMSVSKVLTAMCVLDHVEDLKQTITYHLWDTNIAGFYVKDFFPDDEITYEDALYVMMLESSNVTAQALARSVGSCLND